MIARFITLALILLLAPASVWAADTAPAVSQPATMPAGPVCVALLDAEVLADLPAQDRKAIAQAIDILLTESLTKEKGLVLIDRQSLDKVLAEKASTISLSKVASADVAAELRPFWAAGILICPVVRQLKTDPNQAPGGLPNLALEIDALLAQTGQPLGEAHVPATWQNHTWDKAPALAAPLKALCSDLPAALHQATSNRYIEIADVRLNSTLHRLQWMTDDFGDALRASLAQPGVAMLRPRHPASTKEERLLRIMGLSSSNSKDPSATLSCSPDFRLDAELTEEPGDDLDYDKTPITLTLTLQGHAEKPLKQTFTGKASQYVTLSQQSSEWLNKQLAGNHSAINEAQDQEYSRQMAQHELTAARQMLTDCPWYSSVSYEPGQEALLRAGILQHALRASHLDPANEEAARLTALGIDSPYCLRGDARSTVCADRVIAEGQRYLERFAKNPNAEAVRQHISGVAFQQLTEMRQHGDGDWISLPYDVDIWRYAKIYLLSINDDVNAHIEMNLWADANVLGQCVLGHCPPDRLAEERAYWRTYWKKTIEPLKGDPPPWDFVDLNYFIRQKDRPGLRDTLSALARNYPRSHQNIWWGTAPYQSHPGLATSIPCWKVRLQRFLKLGGDPDWKTWEPAFSTESFTWNIAHFRDFSYRLNPPLPRAWDDHDALPLPGARITIDLPDPSPPPGQPLAFRPLLSSGGFLWLCQPSLTPQEKPSQSLWVIPLAQLYADQASLKVTAQSVSWPDPDSAANEPPHLVQCWTETLENKIPTVWLGTNFRGLLRFDLKDGKWTGQCYAARQGVPGEDILFVRPCLHQGQPKLLILSQPRQPRTENSDKYLWVLDPSTGQIRTLLTSKEWQTLWYKYNNKHPEYLRLVAQWKDHTKVPLCLYDRSSFPKLDLTDIVSLQQDDGGFALAKTESSDAIWQFLNGSLVQFDAPWTPTRLRNSPPIEDDFFYYASPDQNSRFALNVGGSSNWRLLQGPMIDLECTTGPPPMVWDTVGMWEEVRQGASLIAAYRPAAKTPLLANDTWYGPWKSDNGVASLDFIDGHLWAASYTGELYRFTPSQALAQAQEHHAVGSTTQWRPDYQRRLESSWRDAVRMHLTLKEYDQALTATATARKAAASTTMPATFAADLALYEALVYARQGDAPAADHAYQQLADDPKAEPYIRCLALIALANVRLGAKDWPGMNKALDKLVALFPDLNAPNDFSEAKTIQWYRDQAPKNAPAIQPQR